MADGALLPFFLAGLLGGPHCVGMCGGIVGALGALARPGAGHRGRSGVSLFFLHLAYHLGRIASYTLAGSLAGGLGGALLFADSLAPRLLLLTLSGLMLVGMGLYLMGLPQLLLPLETAGARLWERLRPLSRPFIPVRGITQALPLGFVWGWLPCGLVYTALAAALASGSAGGGALTLLAFGLGTLPNLLAVGLLAARMGACLRHRIVRLAAGLAVAAFGLRALIGVFRLAIAN